MSLIDIVSFSKPQSLTRGGSGGSSANVVTYTTKNVQNATYADKLANPRKIWGQLFDGTKDVDGDFLLDRNKQMSIYGPWLAGSYYSKVSYAKWIPALNSNEMSQWYWRRTDVKLENGSLTFDHEDDGFRIMLDRFGMHGNKDMLIETEGEMTLSASKINLDMKNGDIHANSGYFNNLYDNGTGAIYVGSPMILDEGLVIQGDLTVENLYSQNITNEREIKTKDLTVTGNAHFFNLVIDEVKHAGGQIILSAASFRIDDVLLDGREVEAGKNYGVAGDGRTDSRYKTIYLYQVCEDEDGQEIQNQFQPLDHIMCYTANISEDSEFEARSFWTLVWRTAHKVSHTINGERKNCNVLEIVTKVKVAGSDEWIDPFWGEVNAKRGDNCALLGSHNRDRRSAIVMAAYKSFDNNISAPCIAQYENIHNWTLTGCATTYFAKNGNRIQGDLFVNGGEAVEDIIEGLKSGYKTYLHTAWSNSADGTVDFSKTPGEYAYIGLCSNFESDDTDLQPEDYKWSKISESRDALVPARERLYLASDDNCYLDVAYMTDYFSTQDNTIEVVLWTYAGAKTTRRVTDVSPDGLRSYTGIIQMNWSQVTQPGDRYCGGTVYLKSPTGDVLDSHSLVITFDAGAILQVTDIIKARVTDAEGNINSLIITAKSLNERLTDAEGNYNDLWLTVQGLHAEIDQKPTIYEDGWIRDKFAQYDVSIDGLSAELDSIELNGYDDTWIKEKHHQLDVSIGGLETKVENIELNGYDDTSIREQISDLKVSVEGLQYNVVDEIIGCQNLLNGTAWGISEDIEVFETWSQNFTTNPPSLSQGPDSEHGYATVTSGSVMQHPVTGILQPATWYTVTFWSTSPNVTFQIDSNCADTTANPFICGERSESGNSANTQHSFVHDASKAMPGLNGFNRYWMSFKTRADLSGEATLILKLTAGSDLKMAMVKLEEGKFSSTYDYSPRDREGMFKVSSDEAYIRIRDGLKVTGIDITSGKLDIRGEQTTIYGNLDVKEANDSGIVLYGADNFACAQIQPKPIGNFADFVPQIYGYIKDNYSTGTGSSYSITTAETVIGQITAGTELLFDHWSVYIWARDSASQLDAEYPTGDATVTLTIKCNDTQVWQQTVTATHVDRPNFSYTGRHTYRAQTTGNYSGYLTVSAPGTISTSQKVARGQFSVQYTYNSGSGCTTIGTNGMYSAADVDKLLWSGEEGVFVKQKAQSLKISEDGMFIGKNYAISVSDTNVNTVRTAWFPIWNYAPIWTPLNFKLMNVPSINEQKWCHCIDPFTAYGDCYVSAPALDSNYREVETWILLPKVGQAVGGALVSLPVGYRIRITNGMLSRPVRLYVSTQELASLGGYDSRNVIYDANLNGNRYCELHNTETSDVFYWDGHVWRQTLDTQ